MSDITQVLANHDVSIESLLQNPPQADQATVSIVLLTHVASASVMTAVMQEITALTAGRDRLYAASSGSL